MVRLTNGRFQLTIQAGQMLELPPHLLHLPLHRHPTCFTGRRLPVEMERLYFLPVFLLLLLHEFQERTLLIVEFLQEEAIFKLLQMQLIL